MGEVITDKDKEYEKMEREAAPGPDQAMSDRVNNRSLRPRSEAFKEFMTTGWDDRRSSRWSPPSTRRRVWRRWARRSRASVS